MTRRNAAFARWRRAFGVVVAVTTITGGANTAHAAEATPERAPGSFRVECELVGQRPVDPIASFGRPSHHVHDLFGNTSLTKTSTHDSLLAGSTNCTAAGDRSGYWTPSLVSPHGRLVKPERGVFYYRNRLTTYGRTASVPRGLRMIAGGSFPDAYWTCAGESDTAMASRRAEIPDCGADGSVKLHVLFPQCWDGKHLDSKDHRDHVAYGLDRNGDADATEARRCPASHPVKIPQLDLRVLYDVADGSRFRLSDGNVVPHADFLDAWVGKDIKQLVRRCLGVVGKSCGVARS
jgi:hypothetical protein